MSEKSVTSQRGTQPGKPLFLSVNQVAELLGKHPNKVREDIRRGLIPAYDLSWGTGRMTYGIKPTDLEELIESFSINPARPVKRVPSRINVKRFV
mgnify:CR=1 FL=1